MEKFLLNEDGLCIFNFPETDIHSIRENASKIPYTLQEKTLAKLPKDYMFLDYSYDIVNSSIYTFHRDVTSSQRFQKLKKPSYTLIIYLTPGKHLAICPGTHSRLHGVSEAVEIQGEKNQAILFNADCVHAAAAAETTERHAIQFKICHETDTDKLSHLNNQHVVKHSRARSLTATDFMLRKISLMTIPVFDLQIFGKYIERKQNSVLVEYISKKFDLEFYNSSV